MLGIKEVGKYNIDFEGRSYDGNIPYEMVIIEEFNGNTPVKGSRKTLYFRQNTKIEDTYIIPKFNTEEEIKKWLQYRNNAKIQIYNKIVVEEVK